MDTNKDNSLPIEDALNQAAKFLGLGETPKIVGPDDEFEFECQQCGSCCINRDDILLNAFDIYNASSYLGITCDEFIKTYTDRTLGGSSKMPIVTLKSDSRNGYCPFLKFDYMNDGKFKCTIDPAKPGACRTHPIGIMSECEVGNDGSIVPVNLNFIKIEQCDKSKTGKMNKVKDWMSFYLAHKDESIKAHEISIMTNSIVNWKKLYFMVGVFIASAKEKGCFTENDSIARAYNVLANTLIERAYAHYDTSKPFIEQCTENCEVLRERFQIFATNIMPYIEILFHEECGKTVDEILEEAEKDENGEVDLEKLMYDIGRNHCNYVGILPDSEEGDDDSGE